MIFYFNKSILLRSSKVIWTEKTKQLINNLEKYSFDQYGKKFNLQNEII